MVICNLLITHSCTHTLTHIPFFYSLALPPKHTHHTHLHTHTHTYTHTHTLTHAHTVDTIIGIVDENPEAKEAGLAHLCEFIEDCEHTVRLNVERISFLVLGVAGGARTLKAHGEVAC